MKKIPFDEAFFSRNNEHSFYWAGMLAADGCLMDRIQKLKTGNTTHTKTIDLTLKEKDMIMLFAKDIKCFGKKIKERYYQTLRGPAIIYRIELNSHQMFNDLLRFGLTPAKSKTLKMPNWLKKHRLVHHFIRGYFDGDGSIFMLHKPNQKDCKNIEFRGTVSFLESINRIIKKNIDAKTKAAVHIHSDCGSLKYVGNILTVKVGQYLYKNATIYMERKYKKLMI